MLLVFLVGLIAIIILSGLIFAIEQYIIKGPLPNMLRLAIGLILIVIIVIYVLNNMGGT